VPFGQRYEDAWTGVCIGSAIALNFEGRRNAVQAIETMKGCTAVKTGQISRGADMAILIPSLDI
jgi:hypothetical protein